MSTQAKPHGATPEWLEEVVDLVANLATLGRRSNGLATHIATVALAWISLARFTLSLMRRPG